MRREGDGASAGIRIQVLQLWSSSSSPSSHFSKAKPTMMPEEAPGCTEHFWGHPKHKTNNSSYFFKTNKNELTCLRFFYLFGATPKKFQVLLLALHLGLTPGGTQRIMWGAKD